MRSITPSTGSSSLRASKRLTHTAARKPSSQKATSNTKRNSTQQMKQDQGNGRSSIAGDPVLGSHGHFCQSRGESGERPRSCGDAWNWEAAWTPAKALGAMEGMASLLTPFAGKPDPNEPSAVAGVVFIGTYRGGAATPQPQLRQWFGYHTRLRHPRTRRLQLHPPEVRRYGATRDYRTSPSRSLLRCIPMAPFRVPDLCSSKDASLPATRRRPRR